MVGPQRYVHVLTPRTCECDLVWGRGFVDVMRLKISRREDWVYYAGPGSHAGVFVEGKSGHGQMEAEMEAMLPQAKDLLEPPQLEGAEKDGPQEPLETAQPS